MSFEFKLPESVKKKLDPDIVAKPEVKSSFVFAPPEKKIEEVKFRIIPPKTNDLLLPVEKKIEAATYIPKPLTERKEIDNKEDLFERLRKKIDDQVKAEQKGFVDHGAEYEVFENQRFMKKFKRYEMKAKDHSGMIVAMGCLRKYFYKEVLGFVPQGEMSIYLPWGSAYHLFRHKLSELYGYGDTTPRYYDEEKAKQAFGLAGAEAIKYWLKYGTDQKPGTDLEWFTRGRLTESLLKAFQYWIAERKRGAVKVIAVEQYFNFEMKDGNLIQGRIDEATDVLSEVWNRDFKTTAKDEAWFSRQLVPNNQVRTYTYGLYNLRGKKPVKGAIIQVLYNSKSTKKEQKGPEVYEKSVECTMDEINKWEDEQIHWNRILKACREKDEWPQSPIACPWCEFRGVCERPTEAAQMYHLETKYIQRTRNPAKVVDD